MKRGRVDSNTSGGGVVSNTIVPQDEASYLLLKANANLKRGAVIECPPKSETLFWASSSERGETQLKFLKLPNEKKMLTTTGGTVGLQWADIPEGAGTSFTAPVTFSGDLPPDTTALIQVGSYNGGPVQTYLGIGCSNSFDGFLIGCTKGGSTDAVFTVDANGYVWTEDDIHCRTLTCGTVACDILSVGTFIATSPIPVMYGGTGSAIKNFVDLLTNQLIGGAKEFTGNLTLSTNFGGGEVGYTSNLTYTKLACLARPITSASSPLVQIGGMLQSGNGGPNGGTWLGIGAPDSGEGSNADLLHFEKGGLTKFRVDAGGTLTCPNEEVTDSLKISSTVSNYTMFSGITKFGCLGLPIASQFYSLVQIGKQLMNGSVDSTGGTWLGIGLPASGLGSTANPIHIEKNGVTVMKVSSEGILSLKGGVVKATEAAQGENYSAAYLALANVANGGARNTAVGEQAMQYLIEGADNTAFGYQALQNTGGSGADGNAAFGHKALKGSGAGTACTMNVAIGNHAGALAQDGSSYNIYIGCSGENDGTEAVQGNSANFGVTVIGTDANSNVAIIHGIKNAPVTGNQVYISSSGQLGIVTSSIRYKKEIRDVDESLCDRLHDIKVKSFKYLTDADDSSTSYGMIAEEVLPILGSDFISFDKVKGEDKKPVVDENGSFVYQCETICYQKIWPLMLREIQRLATRLEAAESWIRNHST